MLSTWIILGCAIALAVIAALFVPKPFRRKAERDRDRRLRTLAELPQKSQFELVRFYENRSPTLAVDPAAPPVRLLLEKGILVEDIEDGRRLTVAPDFWDVMPDWVLLEMRGSIRGSHQRAA